MKLFKWGALLIILATITSCYPDYNTSIEDHDLVYTLRNSEMLPDDDGQDKFKYYFLPDTIIHVGDSIKDDKDPDFPRDFDAEIIEAVERNLDALGYVQIEDTLGDIDPDVLITVSALALRKTVVYSYYPGYWWGGGYWGDWWWGYPGGYWPMYPSYSVYTFNKGSIFIDMVSFETRDDMDIPVGDWTAAINGLLYESNTPTEKRIVEHIDKAFDESPYLRVK